MHLSVRKSTEINITREDTILFSRGEVSVDVATGTVGNFDCTPYEPKNLEWGFRAELHRYDGRLWVRVIEYEQTVEVVNREWVSRTEEEEALYVSEDGGDTWTRCVKAAAPFLDETTLLDQVHS